MKELLNSLHGELTPLKDITFRDVTRLECILLKRVLEDCLQDTVNHHEQSVQMGLWSAAYSWKSAENMLNRLIGEVDQKLAEKW